MSRQDLDSTTEHAAQVPRVSRQAAAVADYQTRIVHATGGNSLAVLCAARVPDAQAIADCMPAGLDDLRLLLVRGGGPWNALAILAKHPVNFSPRTDVLAVQAKQAVLTAVKTILRKLCMAISGCETVEQVQELLNTVTNAYTLAKLNGGDGSLFAALVKQNAPYVLKVAQQRQQRIISIDVAIQLRIDEAVKQAVKEARDEWIADAAESVRTRRILIEDASLVDCACVPSTEPTTDPGLVKIVDDYMRELDELHHARKRAQLVEDMARIAGVNLSNSGDATTGEDNVVEPKAKRVRIALPEHGTPLASWPA